MTRYCPLPGCTSKLTKYSTTEERITFDCPRHGQALYIHPGSLTAEQRDKLNPPELAYAAAASPYKGLPNTLELQRLLPSRTANGRYDHYRRKIVHRFVSEFAATHLRERIGAKLYKKNLYSAWKTWFAGHYYALYVTSKAVGEELKRLGYRDDPNCKYFLDVELC